MKRSRYTNSQIMAILKQAEAGTPVLELCREHSMSSATFYKWGDYRNNQFNILVMNNLILAPRHQLYILFFLSFFSISALTINPAYAIALVPLLGTLILITYRANLQAISMLGVFSVVLLFCFQIYGINILSDNIKHLITLTDLGPNNLSISLFCVCVLLGVCTYEVGIKTSFSERIRIYHSIPYFLLPYLLIELVSRIINRNPDESWLYAYKHGWFYFDSNFLGITLVLILSFYKFLQDKNIYKLSGYKKAFLLFFLFTTVSRAAILTYLLSAIILKFSRHLRFFALFFGITLFFVLVWAMNAYINGAIDFKMVDGSFNSKFYIMQRSAEFFSELPLSSKFFGIGLANTQQYIEIFAHNILVTFMLEFGLLGTLILIAYFIGLYVKSKAMVLYIFIPTVIVGFSLFSAYSPHLFILSNLILVECNRKKFQNDDCI